MRGTCPHSRLLMARRVEEEVWTLTRAAEAASVSVRTVSKWLRCYRRDGEEGLLDRSSVPRSIPHRTPEEQVQAIAAFAPAAYDGSGDRRGSLDAALDRLRGAEAGQARRAPAHRRQETWENRPAGPPRQRRPAHQKLRDRLGVRSCLRGRRDQARLRRGARGREGDERGRLPPPRARPLPRARDPWSSG